MDKYKSTRKRKRKSFLGTPYHSIRANTGNIDDGLQPRQHENEGMLLSLSAETDVPTCSSDYIEHPTIISPNENIEMGADISTLDVSSRKLAEKEVLPDDAEDGNNESGVIPCSGYKIIDSDILVNILNFCSQCPCKTGNSLTIFQNQKSKRGMCEKLILKCSSCKSIIKL